MRRTCLYQITQERPRGCKTCIEDYNLSHHPNNLDCKSYTGVTMLTFEVKDKTIEEKIK